MSLFVKFYTGRLELSASDNAFAEETAGEKRERKERKVAESTGFSVDWLTLKRCVIGDRTKGALSVDCLHVAPARDLQSIMRSP